MNRSWDHILFRANDLKLRIHRSHDQRTSLCGQLENNTSIGDENDYLAISQKPLRQAKKLDREASDGDVVVEQTGKEDQGERSQPRYAPIKSEL